MHSYLAQGMDGQSSQRDLVLGRGPFPCHIHGCSILQSRACFVVEKCRAQWRQRNPATGLK